VKPIETT